MLVSMFAVVGVALLSRLWLRVPLHWGLVAPVATVMIGGACMVLVPDILVRRRGGCTCRRNGPRVQQPLVVVMHGMPGSRCACTAPCTLLLRPQRATHRPPPGTTPDPCRRASASRAA